MTKINVKDIEQGKDGKIYLGNTSTEVEITPIRPAQFTRLMKEINATQKDLQSNENFKNTVTNLFGEYAEGFDLQDLFRDENFNVFGILDAIGFLLEEAPERLMNIVEITSGIKKISLEHQDMDTYFDVIDAVIEVNDIEKLVARVKKLSTQLGKAFSFLRAKEDAQQPNLTAK